jgi:two-component system, NarL family, invasion response regulator UvrY
VIQIGIVDDHPVSRAGLTRVMSEQVDFQVVAQAASGAQAIEIVRIFAVIDVLVMGLAGRGSGLDAVGAIRAEAPGVAILILSANPDEHYAVSLIRQGASGYLNKDCEPMEVVNAIRALAQGRRYLSAAIADRLLDYLNPKGGAPHEQLSQREFQVFLGLAKGNEPSTIAAELSLSRKTVSTYRARLMEKMKLSSNSDLTYYALTHKLLD